MRFGFGFEFTKNRKNRKNSKKKKKKVNISFQIDVRSRHIVESQFSDLPTRPDMMTHLQGISHLSIRGRRLIKPRNHSRTIYDVLHTQFISYAI